MRRLGAALACVAALAIVARPAEAQNGFVARLSADTVEVGDVFSLLVRVPVPAGSVVFFPDTVARTDFLESNAPVRWEADSDPSGGAVVTLDYPVMAFGIAVVPVPGFDVFVVPASATSTGETLPGGSFVGAWADIPNTGPPGARPLRVPRRGVWVNPVFTQEQIDAGVVPALTADVVGASWHWPSVLAALAFAMLLAFGATRIGLAWRRRRSRVGGWSAEGWTPEASRREALAQLARLRDEGLAASGRMHELYTRSTTIVRTHAARVVPTYGSDLTGTELVGQLAREEAEPSPPAFADEMHAAEVVKFGRLRPAQQAAEQHLSSLGAWLERWRSRT